MTRDNTLITDPNSLFAISRALRKTIIKTDQNPTNRNNAIRDEKHLAYRSNNKDQFETFKYDILTNLEQLDNYILELETVLGKITSDEDAVKLAQSVRKEQVKKQKADTKADTPKKKGRPRKVVVEGAGRYRGGALFIDQSNVIQSLRDSSKSASITPTLREIIKFFFQRIEGEDTKFKAGMINKQTYLDFLEQLYDDIINESSLFNVEDLSGTDEEVAIDDIFTAFKELVSQLPDNLVPLEPATVADVEASLKGKRRAIPILTGNEFIIGTLSKINIILTKLIAEYNGKILVNYKKFLQSDLEEIALKVIDTQRRFNDLINYLQDYERSDKSVDIRKFLETIDNKFKQFIALSSRSIANFVNPNIQFLPNFSQQLSGKTFENQTQPFNLYQEILGNEQTQKNIVQTQKIIDDFNKKIDVKNKSLEKLYSKSREFNQKAEVLQNLLQSINPNSRSPTNIKLLLATTEKFERLAQENDDLQLKIQKLESDIIELEQDKGRYTGRKPFRPLAEDAFLGFDLPAVPDEQSRLARQHRDLTDLLETLDREYQRVAGDIAILSGRDSLSPTEQREFQSLRNERDNIVEAEERNRNLRQAVRERLQELAM